MIAAAPDPFEDTRRIGTVTAVGPAWVRINLPYAAEQIGLVHHGDAVPRGEVGEYVCFRHGSIAVLGRIREVILPERDRLSVEPTLGKQRTADPVGTVDLLTDIDLELRKIPGSISNPPRLGVAAYSISSAFVRWILEATDTSNEEGEKPVALRIGEVPGSAGVVVHISPDRLFGRHCAVLGATGGGKSWTISRLVEECLQFESKIVLLDATGEFHTLRHPQIRHCSLGLERDEPSTAVDTSCPYTKLEERDLFALFTPSGQSQAPVLREAIRSLKLAKCGGLSSDWIEDGNVHKTGKNRNIFFKACKDHASMVESLGCAFEIERLPRQINLECIHPTSQSDDKIFGNIDQRAMGYSVFLGIRIESMLKGEVFAPIFSPRGRPAIHDAIDDFLSDPSARVLRISLRFLSFAQAVRPIVANAIGRHLLTSARTGRFHSMPLVCVLDEAHQFLGKLLGEEGNIYALDAFDLIAKEGRKYGLNLCLATQRPRDIQDGVLSQIGTMLVHRLTHGADRDTVERGVRDVERSVTSVLPTLGPGHAILLGVDFPVPIPIRILSPTYEPDSRGPEYGAHWARKK